jgi:hypothetical protein
MKKSELLQLVEKKGKRANSIAWIFIGPKIERTDWNYKNG